MTSDDATSVGGDERLERVGFIPIVRSESDIALREAGSFVVAAGRNVSFTESGTGFLVAGGDVSMREAGAGTVIVGGSVEITDGAAGSVWTPHAEVSNSKVGVLMAARADLDGVSVLVGTGQAIAIGVAAAATLFLLKRLIRR
jgi:hypothetical protein